MNTCLVTKYDASVNSTSLMRVGEMRIHVSKVDNPTSKTQGLSFQCSEETKIEIIGNGYFTDSTLQQNYGKIATVPAMDKNVNNNTAFYVSNGDYDIAILSKYNILRIYFYSSLESNVSSNEMSNKGLDLEALKFSKDLQVLNVSSLQNTGDISSLKDLNNLSYLAVLGNLQGDISSLKDLNNLSYISIPKLNGDIDVLSKLSKLTQLSLKEGTFVGDLATLPESCYFVSFADNNGTSLTWSTRPSTAKILAIEGNAVLDNVDKMLQDQSNCVASVSEVPYLKRIIVSGTRTSASDDAVQKLQNNGYTVTINSI